MKIRRISALLLTVFLLWSGILTVSAALEPAVISLFASILLEGTLPEKEDIFEVVLIPENELTPMPDNGADTLHIKGADTATFSPIQYSSPGIYQYTLRQNTITADCTCDTQEYYVKVYVVNGAGQLDATVILYQTDEMTKLEQAVFTNVYPTVKPEAGNTESVTGTNQVETGDRNDPSLYTMWMLLSIAVIWRMYHVRKRKLERNVTGK